MKRTKTILISIAAVFVSQLAFLPAADAAAQRTDRALNPVRKLPQSLRTVDPGSGTAWAKDGRGIAITAGSAISMRPVTTGGQILDSSQSEKVILGSGTDSDSVIQRTTDGGRIIEVLHSSKAPSAFTYELDIPQGQTLTQLPDGSILVGNESRAGNEVTTSVSGILPPAWARDSLGKSVPARYTIDGTRVTMHVDQSKLPKSSYPIVADPTLSGGGWQASYSLINPASVTIKANKKRTSQIAGDEGNVACAFLGVIPGIGAALVAVCLLDVYLMKKMYQRGYCVGSRTNIITRQHTSLIYKGGFCT